jgi:DNA polymerase-3 subunit gamma/tau
MEVGDVVKKRYTDQASECSDDFLFSCIELCNECDLSIKASKNQRLHVEIWLIKLCNLTQKKKADVEDDSKVLDISQETEPENHNQEEKKEVNVEIRPADKVEESEVPVNGPGVPDALNDKPQTGRADDLSITEALKTVDNHSPDNRSGPKEEVVNANGNEERGSSPAAKIDTADFLSGWNEFVKSLKKEEPRMYSALRNQAPDVTDGSSIVFSFINNAQMQEFKQKIRPLMVSFFKERTDLTGINIEAILYKEDKEPDAKFLTEVDKLKHMTSKNPVLQKLRQEFNLDFE